MEYIFQATEILLKTYDMAKNIEIPVSYTHLDVYKRQSQYHVKYMDYEFSFVLTPVDNAF